MNRLQLGHLWRSTALCGVLCAAALTGFSASAAAEGGEHGTGQGGGHGGGGGSGEGGHGGGHHAPHVEFWKWDMNAPPVGWLAVDFALFLIILVRFGGRSVTENLRQNHQDVKKAIQEAAAAKADAEKKAREYEERLKALDGEVATLRREFKEGGEAARVRIVQAAEKTAERMRKDADAQIAAEEARARDALKAEAARLALGLAEQRVKEQLKAEDHARLNKDFVRELGA
jgi:F-type H+-transporting ATPase subunit b